jgi:polysaccharide export outer membrane protein
VVVALAPPVAAAAVSPRPELVAVEAAPHEDVYLLICRGACPHQVVYSEDGLQVMVELPGVANSVDPSVLPGPGGLLSGLSIGGGREGDDSTRVLFALLEPATATATADERGIELRFERSRQGNGTVASEAREAAPAGGTAGGARAGASAPAGGPQAPPIHYRGVQMDTPPTAAPGGAGEPAAATVPSPVPADPARERPVGREDLLEISVFEVPELSRTVRVSEKGRISLPLLGEIEAAGLTASQLQERLRTRLTERYVRDPQVSVFVREHGSKRVSVLGAVGKPGVYEMLGPRTLLQVLAQAGGLTEDVGAELYVIRQRSGGESDKIAINVNDLLVSRNPALNLPVEPGDVVSAPIDRPVYIYVDGAVKTPGRIEQLASRPITLLQAIAKAGGATERANLKAVQILRQSPDGTQTMVEANLKRIRRGKEPDPILGEGDVVVIPETFF